MMGHPGIDRLTFRLAAGVTALVVGILSIGFYTASHHHFDHMVAARREAAQHQNRIIDAALRHQMLEKNTELINEVLGEVGRQPEVDAAMILDHGGVVKFSSKPSLLGTRIPSDSPTCYVCHAFQPRDRNRWVVLPNGGTDILRSVLPIENRKSCHACHPPDRKVNGILILDVSLAAVQTEARAEALRMALVTGVLALCLLAGVSLLVRQVVLVRLAALGKAARSIAAGNLDVRAPLAGPDRLTDLALDFNHMADAVQLLVADVRSHESQLRSVMNSLDDGLVVLDREFRVVGCNHSFCRRVGAHAETLRGRRCGEAVAGLLPCGRPDGECVAASCLASAQHQRVVFRETFGGDELRVEEVSASPVLDEAGAVVQVVEVWRDITQRVREEEGLAEIERLASLGVLASGFSHEMNTPLASTLTCAESAIAQIDGATAAPGPVLGAVRELADTIRQEILRCRKITERFLRFARGIPPSIELIELGPAVAGVVSLAATTARQASVTIEMKEEPALPAVQANTEVVQHVILNLLINAIQSCEGRGGTITVSFAVGAEVGVRIRDSGCGIQHQARRRLFEPFRTHKAHGTGLGLFLSRSFMRRFGGDVRLLESQAGAGSTFEVVFRRAGGA